MIVGIAALGLYSVAWVCLLLSFKQQPFQRVFYIFMLLALGMHLYFLYRVIDTPHGQNLHVFNILSLITALWMLVLWLANFSTRLKSLFVGVVPLAGLSIMGALQVSSPPVEIPWGDHPWALAHILSALAAYALLGVAFLQALALALQRWYLAHAPAHEALSLLPPLEAMQKLMFNVLLAAFVILTFGLALGFVAHPERYLLLSFKNIMSMMVWVLCALLLVIYYRRGIAVRYAILGTGLAWFGLSMAYLGMKFLFH